MNCEKDQLAMIVKADPGESGCDLGKIVRVVGPGDEWSDIGDTRFHWDVDTLGQRLEMRDLNGHITTSDGIEHLDIADSNLRPINDPGEDATDEMVLRVGKPVANPEGVPA